VEELTIELELVYNYVHSIDLEETKKKVERYKVENSRIIEFNEKKKSENRTKVNILFVL
jgi:hypothetical protein